MKLGEWSDWVQIGALVNLRIPEEPDLVRPKAQILPNDASNAVARAFLYLTKVEAVIS